MFSEGVTLHGLEAKVAWSYRTAAVCRSWTVQRSAQGFWTLSADVTRADPYQLRQQPLRFAIPRRGGWYTWPILTVSLVNTRLAATLGPPEA